ncbi:MAG TPA: DUF3142 domain-containing protein [Bryobacteraceae bacterium]|nr:DUF3142 domain-containing protein [Bryobacteraceae bacterium]
MRFSHAWLFLVSFVTLCGCGTSFSGQQVPAHWSTGFWFWDGSEFTGQWNHEPLDVVYVQTGTISHEMNRWNVYGQLPGKLPPAREYWAVFRYEHQGVPDVQTAKMVADKVLEIQDNGVMRHLRIAGVQLDIDSPTGALNQYASYIRELRKELPERLPLSVTALLDWFRDGTDVAAVIKEVDEFVPQFYDVESGGAAIAAKIDAGQWGPAFNRFGKRFRVGVSSFGRARMVPREPNPETGRRAAMAFYNDLAPIDLATNPAFQLQASRNQANELVLDYRAVRKVHVGYNQFDVGDAVEFVMATPEMVRSAVASVRKMGGQAAGVVFFRWPSSNEALALDPREVLAAAGVKTTFSEAQNRIEVIDGQCSAVACVDVFLNVARPFAAQPTRYDIRSSTELEYFLPQENMPIRMTGSSRLELALPAYAGRQRLYLGRAVSLRHSDFAVEEEQSK